MTAAPLGVRVLWFAIAALVSVLIYQVARGMADPPKPTVAAPVGGEISVTDAIASASPTKPVTVRGYVFIRGNFPPQLCSGTFPAKPPRCLGPYLNMERVDVSALPLVATKDKDVPVSYTKEALAFRGLVSGSLFTVDSILR